MEQCSNQLYFDENDMLKLSDSEINDKKLDLNENQQQIIQQQQYYKFQPKVDTNIIAIRFDILKENEKNIMMGDPVYCKKCKALLNQKSQIMNVQEYKKLMVLKLNQQNEVINEEVEEQLQNNLENDPNFEDNQNKKISNEDQQQQPNQQNLIKQQFQQILVPQQQKIDIEQEKQKAVVVVEEEEEKKEPIKKEDIQQQQFIYLKNDDDISKDLNENDKVWVCEFCGSSNKVQLEEEEIPKAQDVIYMVQSANQMQQEKQSDDISVIMCIDNSGSMSSTSEVQGQMNFKNGITEEEYNMLKQFIDPGDENQIMPGFQNQNKSWVSRKQCILAAIENQLQDMKKSNPNRKVGLVTFNNEVMVIGDGISKESFTIAGDKLMKFDEIMQLSQQKANIVLSTPIKDSAESLLNFFAKLEEKGQTALGPALLASLGLASQGKVGSMVIICTDGLANIGLGNLEGVDEKQAEEFYEKLSAFAKQVGISVSVITLKGEECKMKILGKIAEETNGTVTRVNPENISKDFTNILKDEMVATNVELQVQLHQALQFRNEDPSEISEDGTILTKLLGNATVNTKVTFEYEIKKASLLRKMKIDMKKLKEIPLQAVITYKNLIGNKMIRVITQSQILSFNKKEVERQARVDVMHALIAQKSANLIQKGRFQEAKQYNKVWAEYVDNNEDLNGDESNQLQNKQFQMKNKILKKAANKKERRMKMEKMEENQQPQYQNNELIQLNEPNINNEIEQQNQEQMQEEGGENVQQQSIQPIQRRLSMCFSEGSGGYSSDEDKDDMFIINYKQGKID